LKEMSVRLHLWSPCNPVKQASVSEGFVETFSNFESNASPFEALVGKVSNNIMLKKKAHASSLKASLARFHSMTPSTPEMSADGYSSAFSNNSARLL